LTSLKIKGNWRVINDLFSGRREVYVRSDDLAPLGVSLVVRQGAVVFAATGGSGTVFQKDAALNIEPLESETVPITRLGRGLSRARPKAGSRDGISCPAPRTAGTVWLAR
jgi:hypothetical protein